MNLDIGNIVFRGYRNYGYIFHWEYVKDQKDGSRELVCEIRGKRINE